ncbi:MAG: S8 family serine peptidase [Deltaproteobacteria bacterium]|nr:S8 family serine peptidase [Deltaproteobacteria bacterium]
MSRNLGYACAAVLFLSFALAGCVTIGDSAPKECIPVQYFCVQPEEFDQAVATVAREYQDDPSFRNQWHLAYIKADEAYANLSVLNGPDAEPGAGVTIGVMHAGIDLDHPAFAGKKVTETFLGGAVDETGEERPSYGTAVASVAAGARTGEEGTPHGVAWGADIAMFAIPTGRVSGTQPEPLEILASADARHAARYERVFSWRDGERKVDILTLPLGFAAGIDGFTEQELRDNYGRAIAALAQADAEEKTILVWAAGDFHGLRCDPAVTDNCRYGYLDAVSPNILAGLAAPIEELRGHSIVVAGVGPADGEMYRLSNRCGIAADYCVVAPAEDIGVAYFGPTRAGEVVRTYTNDYWTQYSASMVSGGLAIMKQLFRDRLSNTELVARLLETADNSGVYADRTLYGRGLVDLGAATSPVGVLEVPVETSVGRNGFRLLSTSISPGTAFGDGLQRSLASREVMAVDRLGAPFWYPLGDFAGAAGGPSVSERLRGFLAPAPAPHFPSFPRKLALDPDRGRESMWGGAGEGRQTASVALHATRLEAAAHIRGSHMSLAEGAVQATLAARNGVSAAAFTTKGLRGQRPTVGAALSWRRIGSPWGVRAGWIGEPKTLLGSVGEGGFGGLAADTSFLGVDAHTDLAGWRLAANAELGVVVPDARGGFVDRVSSLATSAFALHASRALAGAGAVRFSVSQPLRVERGRASLTVPVTRTKAGTVSYDALSAGLSPSGRQMDFSGEWLRPLPTGELRLGAVYSHRPGHRKDAGPELTLLGGWRWAF